MFPKPKDMPRLDRGAFRTMDDGREICYTVGMVRQSLAGRKEYRARTLKMLERQGGRCCLEGYAPMCPGVLSAEEATFEHERGRGGGKRDDRIEINGKWINGAAHAICNRWKGSRYIDYNHSQSPQPSGGGVRSTLPDLLVDADTGAFIPSDSEVED